MADASDNYMARGGMPLVRLEAVTKRYGNVVAVENVSLDIHEHEFFALLGPSGCGKTTLLRLLAGFEQPDAGTMLLDGRDIAAVPPHRRPVNMMFQSYALFPHLTVESNIAFGLKQETMPADEIRTKVAEMLALVRLDGLGARKPHQLSGGQRQRVALARALVKRPRLFLLDEPLAALDRKLREETRFELKELQHRLGLTFIIVTHDQDEAMVLADRIGVMNQGHLVQVGSPAEIYERPSSRWVAGFIGDINLIEGQLAESSAATSVIDSKAGMLQVTQSLDVPRGTAVWIAVRPEQIAMTPEAQPDVPTNSFAGKVLDVGYLGDSSIYQIALDSGMTMKVSMANRARLGDAAIRVDDRVRLSFAAQAAVVLLR